jgi:hypothetical protein
VLRHVDLISLHTLSMRECVQIYRSLPAHLLISITRSHPMSLSGKLEIIPQHMHAHVVHAEFPSIAKENSLTVRALSHTDDALADTLVCTAALSGLTRLVVEDARSTSDCREGRCPRWAAALASSLPHMHKLQELALRKVLLNSDAINGLSAHLARIPDLKAFELTLAHIRPFWDGYLPTYQVEPLVKALEGMKGLRSLVLGKELFSDCMGRVLHFGSFSANNLSRLSLEIPCVDQAYTYAHETAEWLRQTKQPLAHLDLRFCRSHRETDSSPKYRSWLVNIVSGIHSKLTHLDLSYSDTNETVMRQLASVRPHLTNLACLEFRSYNNDEMDITHLPGFLDGSNQDTLAGHQIESGKPAELSQGSGAHQQSIVGQERMHAQDNRPVLRPLTTLTCLCLTGVSCDAPARAALAIALQHLTNLRELVLQGNGWAFYEGVRATDFGCELAPSLSSLRYLTKLDVARSNVCVSGMKAMAGEFEMVKGLQHLNMQGNRIKCEGTESLAAVLTDMPRLTYLNLRANAIQSRGMMCLTEALKSMSGLRSLSVGIDCCTKMTMSAFGAILKDLQSLTALAVCVELPNHTDAEEFLQNLGEKHRLVELHLGTDALEASDTPQRFVALLATAVQQMAGLEKLGLCVRSPGLLDAGLVIDALNDHTRLHSLRLEHLGGPLKGAKKLSRLIGTLPCLESLVTLSMSTDCDILALQLQAELHERLAHIDLM